MSCVYVNIWLKYVLSLIPLCPTLTHSLTHYAHTHFTLTHSLTHYAHTYTHKGSDASKELQEFAEKTIGTGNYDALAMGGGQQDIAINMLRTAAGNFIYFLFIGYLC